MLKTLPSFPSNYSFCSANFNEFTSLNVNYDDESHLARLVLLSQRVNLKKNQTVPTVSFTKLRRRKKAFFSPFAVFCRFCHLVPFTLFNPMQHRYAHRYHKMEKSTVFFFLKCILNSFEANVMLQQSVLHKSSCYLPQSFQCKVLFVTIHPQQLYKEILYRLGKQREEFCAKKTLKDNHYV